MELLADSAYIHKHKCTVIGLKFQIKFTAVKQ